MTIAKAAAMLGVEEDSVYRRLRKRYPQAIRYKEVTTTVISGVDEGVIKFLVDEDGRD